MDLEELMRSIGITSEGKKFGQSYQSAPTDIIIDTAIVYLGDNYREVGPDVFHSADGMRMFRMTESDLKGHRSREPHVHFEYKGRGKIEETKNYHIIPID